MSQHIINATDENFAQILSEAKTPVLVDFWAPWCGPCRAVAPILDEIAQSMGDKVKIVKVEVDENPNTPASFGVRGIPSLFMIKDSNVVDQLVGAAPKAKIVEFIQNNLD